MFRKFLNFAIGSILPYCPLSSHYMEDQSVSSQGKREFLDLDSVIGNKNPALRKGLPRVVLNYLKKVIHQDDLNEIVRKYGHLYGLDFLDACLKGFGVNIIYKGCLLYTSPSPRD